MIAFMGVDVSAEADMVMQPPEEYVLNLSQVALTPEVHAYACPSHLTPKHFRNACCACVVSAYAHAARRVWHRTPHAVPDRRC